MANIAACFSKEFTGFPNTIYELYNNANVWDECRRHVKPADMLIIVWDTCQSVSKLIPWPFI